MNVFRLVLFLAGLAAYLLTKQFLPSSEISKPSPALGTPPIETAQPAPKPEVAPVSTPTPATSRIEHTTIPAGVMGLKKSVQ